MKNFKRKWEISHNWQLIYPILGVLLAFGFGLLIAWRIGQGLFVKNAFAVPLIIVLSLLFTYIIIKISLYCFRRLHTKWEVQARWQMIAIFIVFAITGSIAGRISSPVMDALGLGGDAISGWLYWPLRILIIFPIYQILLICFAWLLGQYTFFYAFEKKMLSRMGLGFLFRK